MTRPDPVAAALDLATRFHEAYERLAPSFGYETREETRTFDPESKTGRLMVAVCGEILRAANPPAGAERATEPVCPVCKGSRVAHEWRFDDPLPCLNCCTPAVGEEAGADCECTCAAELAEKVRALLADVARLQKELDGTTFREERYAEDAVGARLALEDARADVARLKQAFDDEEKAGDLHRSINRRSAEALGKSNEGGNSSWHDIPEQIAALRATLAAVRKIAEDYHDVDVTGDPPREVACNPCANDILNVLEGRKP